MIKMMLFKCHFYCISFFKSWRCVSLKAVIQCQFNRLTRSQSNRIEWNLCMCVRSVRTSPFSNLFPGNHGSPVSFADVCYHGASWKHRKCWWKWMPKSLETTNTNFMHTLSHIKSVCPEYVNACPICTDNEGEKVSKFHTFCCCCCC